MNNGRVTDLHQSNLTTYSFFHEKNKDPNHFRTQAVKHIHTESPVANVFFSAENIQILQDGIRYMVYAKSSDKYIIGNQSETELQIVMRSIYLQYSKNTSSNIPDQVKELNTKVLDYTVPIIINEVHNYKQYTHDISQLPIPMERSKNMSTSGTKVLFRKET